MSRPTPDPTAAYARLLKRRPVQARSIARVDRIVDAAADLLADGDLDALTIRAVAGLAAVPVATIYQFFADKDALIQAVALRYVHRTPAVLEDALGGPPAPPGEIIAQVVEGFAAMLAAEPAMRALWLAGAMDDETRADAAAADAGLAARLRDHLDGDAATDPDDWRFLVVLISGLLRASFAATPAGDRALLERTRRVAARYVEDVVASAPAR